MKGYRCWCGSNKVYEDCHKQMPHGQGLNLHTIFSYPTSWVIRKILDGIKWFLHVIGPWIWLILSIWLQFSIALLYLIMFYDLEWFHFIDYILYIVMTLMSIFLGILYISVLLNATFGQTKEARVVTTCILTCLTSLPHFMLFFPVHAKISDGWVLLFVVAFIACNITIAMNIKRHITALIYGYAGALFQLLGITNLIYVSYFMRS